MKKLKILHTLMNTQELLDGGFALKQAENFGREHAYLDAVRRMEQHNPVYYITPANPEHNYGLDFKIWAFYIADGIKFFKEMSFGGCSVISSSPLQRVIIDGGEIGFADEWFKKDKEFRPALRRLSEAGFIFGG